MNASFNTGTGGLNPENKFDSVLYKQNQNVFTHLKKSVIPKFLYEVYIFTQNQGFHYIPGKNL